MTKVSPFMGGLGIDARDRLTLEANATVTVGTGGTTAGNVNIGDDGQVAFGQATDLRIFHDGTDSQIVNATGLLIQSDFQYGHDQLSHIADNSFNRYALQQNLYKYILEKYYGKKISSMNLLVLHPQYHTFFHVKVPEMKNETKFLINQTL